MILLVILVVAFALVIGLGIGYVIGLRHQRAFARRPDAGHSSASAWSAWTRPERPAGEQPVIKHPSVDHDHPSVYDLANNVSRMFDDTERPTR